MQKFKALASNVSILLQEKALKLATAESCTGGLVAAAITEIAGSSQWFERGFVTYSNEAKQQLLKVSSELLAKHGAVSQSVAIAMAEGALANSLADVSIAITGIAGPDGGSKEKPVGTVWFAWKLKNSKTEARVQQFIGDRSSIRQQAVNYCLEQLMKYIVKAAI